MLTPFNVLHQPLKYRLKRFGVAELADAEITIERQFMQMRQAHRMAGVSRLVCIFLGQRAGQGRARRVPVENENSFALQGGSPKLTVVNI